MSASNRAILIGKLQTALKKYYKPLPAQPTRPLLEHVLYGSLLEDAPAELADEGMAKCEQEFFDWNEVRVTTVTELSQVLSRLEDPVKAARRLKSNLQAIFEEFYTFDLDHMKKDNLGKAVNKFDRMPGMTPFVLSYTVQHGLGGHSIPTDYSAMVILLTTEIASQPEAMSGKVPGLERAIPKNKGIEFAGLLHQAAVALKKDTKDKKARTMLDAVNKGSSKRLDEWLASKKAAKKRAVKRKAEEKIAAEAEAKSALEATKKAPVKKSKAKAAAKKSVPVKKPLPPRPGEQPAAKATPSKKVVKKPLSDKKLATKSAATKATKKSLPAKKVASKKKSTSKKKPVAQQKLPTKKPLAKNKPATKKKAAKTPAKKSKPAKKSANRKLSKRKPR
jgi:hypothetical protein